jgi:general secretion pathway protein D
LLVLLTPRALENDDELRAASDELRQRMRSMSLESLSFPPRNESVAPGRKE